MKIMSKTKTTIKAISAILLAALCLISTMFLTPTTVITDEVSSSSQFKKIVITDGKFPCDYSSKVNEVKLVVKEGVSYDQYLVIKNAIEGTPKVFLKGLSKITISTEHPYLSSAEGKVTPELMEEIKNSPRILGRTAISEKTSRIYLTDSDADLLATYVHELAHSVEAECSRNGKSIVDSPQFQTFCDNFVASCKKEKGSQKKIAEWFASKSYRELFACFSENRYITEYPKYKKFIEEQHPEVYDFMDNLFKEFTETE